MTPSPFPSTAVPPPRPVTGRTVLLAMLAFFLAVFAANGAFIYLALSTFPGVEVASSYKAGQQFEGDVAAARAQAARGWSVAVHPTLTAKGAEVTVTFTDRDGTPLAGLAVTVRLAHTVDITHDRTVALTETGPGVYRGMVPGVGPGHWTIVTTAERAGERLFMSRNMAMLTEGGS